MKDESRLYQVTAFILRSRPVGEGDCLFSLFTREHGKITAVARGVKKPKARLAPALQHFTLAEMQLAQGRRFDVITQVRVLEPFLGLRADIEAFTYGCYFAELFDESLEERQTHPALFDLFGDALHRLIDGDAPELLARYVEINLIAMLGYLPGLAHCTHCETPLYTRDEQGKSCWPEWLGFSARQGGALCPACTPTVPGAKRIAAGTVQVAQVLLSHGTSALKQLKLSERLQREIADTFREYLECRLECRMESQRFLRDWENDLDKMRGPRAKIAAGQE